MVERVVQRDPSLWLSRSWTTREPREGESPDAYRFVPRADFEEHVAAGGFLEWAEFLGNLYGTPVPDPPPGCDVLLEIDVQGAEQVLRHHPDALLIFVDTPSADVQAERLRGRGDPESKVEERLLAAEEERRLGRSLGAVVVINDVIDDAVIGIERLIGDARRQRP